MRQYSDYFLEMEIPSWEPNRNKSYDNSTSPIKKETKARAQNKSIEALINKVEDCKKCELHSFRTKTVFGSGSLDADIVVVGEAPGAQEDKQGVPFVGRAGKLLNSILFSLGLERESVYIVNVLKCRPPDNRDPLGKEVSECLPVLHKQIDIIKPKIIIAMGRFAAQALLETNTPIGELRGKNHYYRKNNIPIIVTYHPAYLLRSPLAKAKAWEDLLVIKKKVQD